jgi:hypothetical protein
MFSGMEITLTAASPAEEMRAALQYFVAEHDDRFQKVQIAVTGRCVTGKLDAFVRAPPIQQAPMAAVAARVDAAEFSDMKALIVGGSRGLGELTAKIIAAGGGDTLITYVQGKPEAEGLVRQIREWGGKARSVPYDVRKCPEDQLGAIESSCTHVFYFATSPIYRPKQEIFSSIVLEKFIRFYIEGFYELCRFLAEASARESPADTKLVAFYPSTIFVAERPPGMTEYAMVKAAGEQLCRDMNQHIPNLRVVASRLPRLLTDQTAGVLPDRELDPIDVLLPIVREMKGLQRP